MWRASEALQKAWEMTGDPRVKKIGDRVAEWAADDAGVSFNMNYNTTPINLAVWYKVTGNEEYIDRGWEIARDGILKWRNPNGYWSGHNSHTWYGGIGMRTLSHLALAMPADHPHYEELTDEVRQATNYVILSQGENGSFYQTWDRLETEYKVRVDVVHPRPDAFEHRTLMRLCKVYKNDPAVLNLTYGYLRWLYSIGWRFHPWVHPLVDAPPLPEMPGDVTTRELPAVITEPPEVTAVRGEVDPVRFGAAMLPSSGKIKLAAGQHPDADPAPKAAIPIDYTIAPWEGDGAFISGTMECPADGEDVVLLDVPADLAEGKYRVTATFVVPGEGETTYTRHFYHTEWEWLDSGLGVSDAPIPPWTPVKLVRRGRFDVLGRQYTLGGTDGLFGQVVNRGAQMLAAPMMLKATLNGEPAELMPVRTPPKFEQTPTRVERVSKLSTPELDVTMTTAVEYDGLATFDVEIANPAAAGLDGLTLDIPVRDEWAKYLRVWSQRGEEVIDVGDRTGVLFSSDEHGEVREVDWTEQQMEAARRDRKLAGTFVPYVYVGSEAGGLAWFADSDEGYAVDDDQPIVQVVRDGDAVSIRVRIVGRKIQSEGPRRVRFCLQAAPVKPMPAGWRRISFVGMREVPSPFVVKSYGSPHWARALNRLVNTEWDPPTMEAIREKIDAAEPVDEYRAVGRVWTQWWPINAISGATGAYENFRLEWGDSIYHDYDPRVYEPLDKPNTYGGRHPLGIKLGHMPSVLSPSMLDYRAFCAAWVLAHTGGVYEVHAEPMATYLPEGGFGYVRDDGYPQPTYNLLALRELNQRIAVLSHQLGKPLCYTVTGGSVSSLLPVGGFALVGRNHHVIDRGTWDKPERLHTILRGQVVGLIGRAGHEFKTTRESGSRELMGVAIPNDIRGYEVEDVEISARADRMLLGFDIGADDCTFHPYWKDHGLAAVSPDSAAVSAHVRSDKALLVVTNRSDQHEVAIAPNFGKLGVATRDCRDLERDIPLELDEQGRLHLEIPPYQYRILWVGPIEREAFFLPAGE